MLIPQTELNAQRTHKALVVAGARPNFMKVAPLLHEAAAYNERRQAGMPRLEWLLVHTGQHYDRSLSDVFFDELKIPPPAFNLGVGSGSHAVQTANIMMKFEEACLAEKPGWVIVVGDVNSTLACALTAAKLGIKVAHVEAGLRSFDRAMPEEINRIVTDALADLLLTPSEEAGGNLRREGIPESRIRFVGNVVMDTVAAHMAQARRSPILQELGLTPKNFAYVTLHRPANVDNPENLSAIMDGLNTASREMPIVFPVHPRTRKMLAEDAIRLRAGPRVRFVEPVGYHASLCLTENARLVLTDSGGLQEESTFLRVPCLTLRPNTERPLTISMGSNKLTRLDRLCADMDEIIRGPLELGRIPPLWDGQAAGRIVQAMVEHHA
ncbi:MAG TPA: UDP-N-acetylglucosamine 2-epimerase (non-hydrolyzing) [Verrucomicrobiae bacterium]|jgi:UDP-N-acetylglucosamine 2-epimerase (non-hydrolysing)